MGISLCRGGSSANRYILIRHSARSDLSLLDRKEESGLIATKPQPISQRVGGTAIRGQHARILLRFTPEGGPVNFREGGIFRLAERIAYAANHIRCTSQPSADYKR